MTNTLCLIAAKFNTTLNLKTAIGATSATLDSATDDSGVALPTGRYGLTIDGGTSSEEFITCTLTGTALTSIKTVTMQGTETSGTTKLHRKGATVKITDFVVIKKMLDLLDGTTSFNSSVTLGYDGTATISSANQFATKAYVDATATGTTNFDQVVIAGNAGATVSAGQLVYLDVADGEWKLCDADTAATVDNIILGIAQGAGTDGNPITGGVLTYGLDSNQSGLTTNTAYYASNTAGAISSSAGTVEVSVGVSRSTTSLFFDPRYNQQITEDIQDALVGTSGTPSGSNKYVTNDDTATAATADKVARRLAGGNITVVTETTGNNTTNASSTAFVQQELAASDLSAIPYLSGAGKALGAKTYRNFSIPFLLSTDVPTTNFWTTTNLTLTEVAPSYAIITAAADATASIITTKSIGSDLTSFSAGITFATTKNVIVEWEQAFKGVGTEQQGAGLAVSNAPFIDYDDASADAACFTISGAGALYSHTSNGDGTTNHTENEITGITLTNPNTYRIEFDPGVNVKFYVNGELKFTHTTHLPSAGAIKFGSGFQGNSNNNDIHIITVPYFSIEK